MSYEPLDIKPKILDQIDGEITLDGNRQRRFPHGGIEIQFYAVDESQRGRYQTAFIEGDSLKAAIYQHLQPPRCLEARPFVDISIVEDIDETDKKRGFSLRYLQAPPPANVEAFLEVLRGVANRKHTRLIHNEFYIGRCRNVVRKDGSIERINDLYFLDAREMLGKIPKVLKEAESINGSVSRLHAHIKLFRDGNYYIWDDGSAKGSTILHHGRGTAEEIDQKVGRKLENGDVVYFGKACVRFRLLRKS